MSTNTHAAVKIHVFNDLRPEDIQLFEVLKIFKDPFLFSGILFF